MCCNVELPTVPSEGDLVHVPMLSDVFEVVGKVKYFVGSEMIIISVKSPTTNYSTLKMAGWETHT